MTPPPSSRAAEEIAKEIILQITAWGNAGEPFHDVVNVGIALIAKALEEYAREAVKDWVHNPDNKIFHCCTDVRAAHGLSVESGAASMRERAIKVCEDLDICACHGSPVVCRLWQAWERISALPLVEAEKEK